MLPLDEEDDEEEELDDAPPELDDAPPELEAPEEPPDVEEPIVVPDEPPDDEALVCALFADSVPVPPDGALSDEPEHAATKRRETRPSARRFLAMNIDRVLS